MSGLLFLSSDDFRVITGVKGNIMCTNIRGISLILFYSSNCKYCKSLIPLFKGMPGKISGCQFGMINVDQNKNCVIMSRDTIAPIEFVPYILLFIDGKPYMRYEGPYDQKEIVGFIIEVSKNFTKRNKNQQHNQQHNQQPKRKSGTIPAYCTGIPICGEDNVCYLDFGKAYEK